MAVKDVLREAEEKMKKTVDVTRRELATARTSRASAGLVDGIKVDYYQTPTPLKQMATISAPEPRLVVINPWDKSVIGEIEKAILKSDLGITPNNDGKVIRLTIPQLTEERRQDLIKVAKKIAEDGRVSIRSVRHAAVEKIKAMEDSKEISNDDRFKGHGDAQKLTDKYIGEINTLLSNKDKEIKEV